MEECELCGRPLKEAYTIEVENVEMRACASCAKGKKIIARDIKPPKQGTRSYGSRPTPYEEKELPDDYGIRIRKARENMKIPIKVLAEKLNEKEHLLLKVEEQKIKPTIKLAKKLEHELGIRLTEESNQEMSVKAAKQAKEATLGDFFVGGKDAG